MKKVRIVNRKKFTRSVSLLLVFFMTLSILAFVSLESQGDTEPQFISVYVKAGDTLWSIASQHNHNNLDIRELIYLIKEENQLVSAAIYPGQELQIPIN